MLRFSCKEMEYGNHVHITENALYMDENIWNSYKSFLTECDKKQDYAVNVIPVRNAAGELIAYGYQDNEADRELRMIRELRENKLALQFTDIYPEYQRVVIYGCNELAVSFAEYLKVSGVEVSVVGEYWNCFGYDSTFQGISGGNGTLVIYAEGIYRQNQSFQQYTLQSVSPEFECIDRIYEANVLKGRISDTVGNFDEFINRLKDEKEIVILGTGAQEQDVYDLLMEHGIDICAFALKEKGGRRLFGKPVMSIADAMQRLYHPIFLDCGDTHGALGGERTEYFDYRGYERNKQFFLVRDYTDIQTSNLVHILHKRKVLLTGDPRLCELIINYLDEIENGEVDVQYTSLSDKVSVEEDHIICLVSPASFYQEAVKVGKERIRILKEKLSEIGVTDYTTYFTSARCIALMELYLNKNNEKYTVPQLLPKGILLGRIPGLCGNVFFRGIMDGHPEVLLIPHSDFNSNLFYYCVRLAGVDSDKLLQNFWKMYDEEMDNRKSFPNQDKFDAKMRSLLRLKSSFTSQELFVMFHIAYAEMIDDKPISDASDLIIYWEPHNVPRNYFPFYALWLEDKKINGHTLALRRNNIVRFGSVCNFVTHYSCPPPITLNEVFMDASALDRYNFKYSHWSEFKLRFEDIKVNPSTELMKVCKLMNIAWSDTLLRTTNAGKSESYDGIVDYNLGPVFTEYADFLSSFDRFKISIASGPFQKKYGYAYYDSTKLSRVELQEMFLKPFLFEEEKIDFKRKDFTYKSIQWKLWEVRKHMVLDDVKPEFPYFDLKQIAQTQKGK